MKILKITSCLDCPKKTGMINCLMGPYNGKRKNNEDADWSIPPDCPLENAEDYVYRWQAIKTDRGDYAIKDALDWDNTWHLRFYDRYDMLFSYPKEYQNTEIDLTLDYPDCEDGQVESNKIKSGIEGQKLLCEKLPYLFGVAKMI